MAFLRHFVVSGLFLLNYFVLISGNAALIRPTARGMMWIKGTNSPTNYNYMGLNCGGLKVCLSCRIFLDCTMLIIKPCFFPHVFSVIFTKGDNLQFVLFLFASVADKIIPKWDLRFKKHAL